MAFMYVCVWICYIVRWNTVTEKKVKKAYNAKFNLTLSDMPI